MQDAPAANYFPDEGAGFLKLLFDLFRKSEMRPAGRKILTLGRLDNAISAGRLDEEIKRRIGSI